jgi:hypothetical protein
MATETSCISHPARQRLVVLREDYLALCGGNHCAAALLNFFEHGHNWKLASQRQALHANEVAERHGDPGMQDTSLLQFQNEDGLEEGLLGLYNRRTIRKAIEVLVSKGFVSIHKNPNSRYHFDKTHYFRFHPETVQPQLIEIFDEELFPHRQGKNASPSGKNTSRRGKNSSTRSLDSSSQITDLDLQSPPIGPPLGGKRARRDGKVAPQGKRKKTYYPTDPATQALLHAQVLDPALEAWVASKGLTVDLAAEWEHFERKALAKGYQNVDWRLAFMNWLTSPYQTKSPPRGQTSSTMDPDTFAAEAAKWKGRI